MTIEISYSRGFNAIILESPGRLHYFSLLDPAPQSWAALTNVLKTWAASAEDRGPILQAAGRVPHEVVEYLTKVYTDGGGIIKGKRIDLDDLEI